MRVKNAMLLGNFISNIIGVVVVNIIANRSIMPLSPEMIALRNLPQTPTIHFHAETQDWASNFKVPKSREKTVGTLAIGSFRAKERMLQDENGPIHGSQRLRALVANRCTNGYDVLVLVGRALFIRGLGEKKIVEELSGANVSISPRQIGYLGGKFIAYPAIAHHQSRLRLKGSDGIAGRLHPAS